MYPEAIIPTFSPAISGSSKPSSKPPSKPFLKPSQQSQAAPNSNSNPTENIQIFRIIADAIYRGGVRTLEEFTPGFRYTRPLTEFVRYLGIESIENFIKDEKVGKEILLNSARKAFENSLATVFIEPNRFNSKLARIGAGFANMVVRFLGRVGLVVLNFVNPEEATLKNLPFELAGRSLFRGIYLNTLNPLIGVGIRTLEQLGINLFLTLTQKKMLASNLNLLKND